MAGFHGGAIRIDMKDEEAMLELNLKSVDFFGNLVLLANFERSAGAAMSIRSVNNVGRVDSYKTIIIIEDVRCLNNTSNGYGGAFGFYLSLSSTSISISESDFRNNVAGRIFSGGALDLYIPSNPSPEAFQTPT